MPSPNENVVKYRLLLSSGQERVVTMPASWNITFGPNVPGVRRDRYGGGSEHGWCFRVYAQRPKKLKVCLPSVVEFWEEGTFDMQIIERDPETQLVTRRLSQDQALGAQRSNRPLANRNWALTGIDPSSMRPNSLPMFDPAEEER